MNIIELHDENIMGTYGRYPVVLTKGKGSTLYDADGKNYIDFTSGIGVNCLGAANEDWINAVTAQLSKIQHVSNYYYSDVTAKLAKKLVCITGMNKIFFANSGAEANEGAVKLARKYSFDKYGKDKKRYTILTLKESFHGRTMTTLTATGQDSFHDYFFPFMEGFRYIEPNNIDSFKKEVTENDDICAVMVEPIQGESGVNIICTDYIREVAKVCNEKDILLIFDEIQTGVGRTGKFLAHEYFGVKADIVTLAKGLGGGLPIGTFMCNEKLEDVLSSGMHGSTFGGNPVVCAGAIEVLKNVAEPEFLDEVTKKGEYIAAKVKDFNNDNIIEIRNKGLMIGIQVNGNPKDYAKKCIEKGLLILTAGKDVLRFLPPLNITNDEINKGLSILKEVMDYYKS